MQFYDNGQPIYLQIAGYVCEKILLKTWEPEAKIPSIRELAVQLAVNPNTVMRTYEFLKQLGVIYDKRGIGYFIAQQAVMKARAYLKEDFSNRQLPSLFRGMYLLGLEPDDLKANYEAFKNQYNENKQ